MVAEEGRQARTGEGKDHASLAWHGVHHQQHLVSKRVNPYVRSASTRQDGVLRTYSKSITVGVTVVSFFLTHLVFLVKSVAVAAR